MQGIIRSSKSPWSSLLHLIPKTDGKSNHVAITVPDRYTPPYIVNFAHALYNQISVASNDREKLAITIPFSSSLILCPSVCLTRRKPVNIFNFIHQEIRGLDFVYVYIDDFLITSSTKSEHKEHVKQLFDRLNQYGVMVNPVKCVFGAEEITFLDCTVNKDVIKPVAERIEAIRNFPKPTVTRALRKFLSMINFNRRFVLDAAKIMAPLNNLLKGSNKDNTRSNGQKRPRRLTAKLCKTWRTPHRPHIQK